MIYDKNTYESLNHGSVKGSKHECHSSTAQKFEFIFFKNDSRRDLMQC